MDYKLDVNDITNILQQKNTLSEELVQRLGEYLKIPELTTVHTHILTIRDRFANIANGMISPLDAQEDTNLTENGPIIMKASGGWNRFFIFPEDHGIYLNDNTLTFASPMNENGYPIRNFSLSKKQIQDIISPYNVLLFSGRRTK